MRNAVAIYPRILLVTLLVTMKFIKGLALLGVNDVRV